MLIQNMLKYLKNTGILLVMTERVNHEKVFAFLFTCERWMVQRDCDSLVYLFGYYVFYWGGGNRDSLTGEEFCRKKSIDNLSLLWCREVIASESQG